MSKLDLTMKGGPDGGKRTKVVAQLLTRSPSGKTTSRSVVLELGRTTTIDVDPGEVRIDVRLPSGELLTEERTLAAADDREAITFGVKKSRREWLGWQQVLSPKQQIYEPEVPDFSLGNTSFISEIRVHREGKAPLELALDSTQKEPDGTYVINNDQKTVSLKIEDYAGGRLLVEMVHADGKHVVRAPLPWFGAGGEPVPVQLILEKCPDGLRADVVVHDPELSPVLAYYATGNLGAARTLAETIESNAVDAVMGKSVNPCAGAAGILVLRNLRRDALQESWLQNLAGIASISDGPILYASYLMDTREGRKDTKRLRSLLLQAQKRGLPVFAQCGRLMRDALSRLYTIESDEEVLAALEWSRALANAQRSETIVTWLAGDRDDMSTVVPDIVPPSPIKKPPSNPFQQH